MGIAPVLPVLLRLPVNDWFYVEFTAWASLPYFQYYSVYWFTTGTTRSLLQGHRSHTASTTPFTGLRLVLHVVYCMGFDPTLPVMARLQVLDSYSMLLKAPRSHDTVFTSSRLVLRVFDYSSHLQN
jgi:hypothetical protein